MLDARKIIKDFPILGEGVHYLDSAATSQKPQAVIDAVANYYKTMNANPHRSAHRLGQEATSAYEGARKIVADFIGAKSEREIVFTKNATEALNILSNHFKETLKEGDEILITIAEHHANFVNWQEVCKHTGARLVIAYLNDRRELNVDELLSKVSANTRVVSFQEASNVTGYITDAKALIREIRSKSDATIIVDGSQSVPHKKTNVADMDCDFLAFSGHKMLSPMGIGVLYGKEEKLNSLNPLLYGGDMIEYVYESHATYLDGPARFEGGTQNVGAAVGLAAAIKYLEDIGMDQVHAYEEYLAKIAYDKLSSIEGLSLYTADSADRLSVMSFNIKGAHPHDIASILDTRGIMVRSGHHCAQPLHRYLGRPFSARASFYIYNTEDEIDALVEGIGYVKEVLKIGPR